MKPFLSARLSLLTLLCATAAVAEEDFDPEPVIEGRQAALRDIGGAFKGISDELKKSAPVLPVMQQYARQIDDLVKQQHLWFPEGTGPDTEIEMAAKQAIWQKPAEFKAAQNAMSRESAKLVTVTNGTDVGAIRKQWQALGKTCKGCHDQFREEE